MTDVQSHTNISNTARAIKTRTRSTRLFKIVPRMYWNENKTKMGTTADHVTPKQPAAEPVVMKAAQGEVALSAGEGIMINPDTTDQSKTKKVSFTESCSNPQIRDIEQLLQNVMIIALS